MTCPTLVIAATGSGTGKTSVTLALVHALTRRGLRVQTFKVGPDYLDPTHLALASGRPCYNLDGWMSGRDYVRRLFQQKTADADFAVIEGVMGLFDGASPDTSEGSTAEIARWLDVPVLLVTNVHGMARSVAAQVKGFANYETDLPLAGVIANHCGSPRHESWIREALSASALPPLLGAIPRGAFPELASRHLGLVTATPSALNAETMAEFANAIERHVTLDTLLTLARPSPLAGIPAGSPAPASAPLTIAIARDAAFHFYYPDNLEALQARGATLVPFSPLNDSTLPAGIDALYLGGGYPEAFAAELSRNTSLLHALRTFADNQGAIYAECGGLMVLSQGIELKDGSRFPMAGILPAWTRMTARRKALGYVEALSTGASPWGPPGTTLRGHEFHYSELIPCATQHGWAPAWQVSYRRGGIPVSEGFLRDRVLASYVHLHFACQDQAVAAFCDFARKGRP